MSRYPITLKVLVGMTEVDKVLNSVVLLNLYGSVFKSF